MLVVLPPLPLLVLPPLLLLPPLPLLVLPPLLLLPPWPPSPRPELSVQATMNTLPEMRLTRIIDVLRIESSEILWMSCECKLRAAYSTRTVNAKTERSPRLRRGAASES